MGNPALQSFFRGLLIAVIGAGRPALGAPPLCITRVTQAGGRADRIRQIVDAIRQKGKTPPRFVCCRIAERGDSGVISARPREIWLPARRERVWI